MPVFLYFILAFLYIIQIVTVQEQIQSAITKMGLNLSKSAYFCKDFPSIDDILDFDQTIFGQEFDIGADELADSVTSGSMLKLYGMKYLNTDRINRSCIKNGFNGISFYSSSIFDEDHNIDIAVKYRVKIPIMIFKLGEISFVQRVKLRAWTGYEVAALYGTEEEGSEGTIVYITESGSVYHRSKDCSHIKLSVTSVSGIPSQLRNDNGSKYYECEACCSGEEGDFSTYYITSEGTRYHTRRDCSKIKRSVKEIPLSEVGERAPCKRCGG